MPDYVGIARRALEGGNQPPAIISPAARPSPAADPGGFMLKGHAVELWTDGMGRTYLVADEEDRRLAMQKLGAGQGETMTEAELELVVRITDPATRREVMQWKRSTGGRVSGYRGKR